MESKYDNLKLHKRMGIPLLIWSGLNIIVGSFFPFSTGDLVTGLLSMTLIWGLINGILGLFTRFSKKIYVFDKIKKVLIVNLYLDLGYAIVGLCLIFLGNIALLVGAGYGVVFQGVFLFILDNFHFYHIKKMPSSR